MRSKATPVLAAFIALLFVVAWIQHSEQTSLFRSNPSISWLSNAREIHRLRDISSRLERAERLWSQSVASRNEMFTAYDHTQMHFPDGYIYPYNVWDYARPAFFCPHDLERVGTLGDGGKWVCGMSRYEELHPRFANKGIATRPLIVYSFGVNDDSSFEAALLDRTDAEIWGYDFTVSSWAKHISQEQLSRAHFTKAGLAKVTNEQSTPPFYSIQDLMRKNNHTYIDLIKMDIEGAEFDVLSSWIASIQPPSKGQPSLPVGQLLIEIHFMPVNPPFAVPQNLETWMRWWSSLEQMGLRPVNNEDNWIGDVGLGRPRFMEYTMINVRTEEQNVLIQ